MFGTSNTKNSKATREDPVLTRSRSRIDSESESVVLKDENDSQTHSTTRLEEHPGDITIPGYTLSNEQDQQRSEGVVEDALNSTSNENFTDARAEMTQGENFLLNCPEAARTRLVDTLVRERVVRLEERFTARCAAIETEAARTRHELQIEMSDLYVFLDSLKLKAEPQATPARAHHPDRPMQIIDSAPSARDPDERLVGYEAGGYRVPPQPMDPDSIADRRRERESRIFAHNASGGHEQVNPNYESVSPARQHEGRPEHDQYYRAPTKPIPAKSSGIRASLNGGGDYAGLDADDKDDDEPVIRVDLTRARMREPSYLRDVSVVPPAISMNKRNSNNGYTVSPVDDAFAREHLVRIRALVMQKVGRSMPDNSALKNMKNIPNPEKYDGEDDVELFENWLKSLLRWLRLNRIAGPELDEERLHLMGQFLKGKAAEWFNDNVDTGDSAWKFSDAICSLFWCFLHNASTGTAADKFYAATYSKDAGVNGLWDELVKYATRMPRQPDDYTFARKFGKNLPNEIRIPLFKSKDVSVETTEPCDLLRAAIQQECNNKVVERETRDEKTTNLISTPHGPTRISTTIGHHARPAAVDGQGDTSHDQRSGGFQRRIVMKSGDFDRQFGAPEDWGQLVPVKPAAQQKGYEQKPSRTLLSVDASGATRRPPTCYSCGEVGHLSSRCPKQYPQLRAARALDGTLDESHYKDAESMMRTDGTPVENNNNDEEVVLVDASQYDPEYEEDPQADYHDEVAVHYGSMRIVGTYDSDLSGSITNEDGDKTVASIVEVLVYCGLDSSANTDNREALSSEGEGPSTVDVQHILDYPNMRPDTPDAAPSKAAVNADVSQPRSEDEEMTDGTGAPTTNGATE